MSPTDQSMIVYDGRTRRYGPSTHTVTELIEATEPKFTLQVQAPAQSSASSTYDSEPPSKAHDGNTTTNWTTDGPTAAWLRYQMYAPLVVVKYSIRRRDDIPERNPSAWTFEGSQEGTAWTILDTQSNITWPTGGETKIFEIPNEDPFSYYRLNITANSGASQYLSVNELSLTAKVAAISDGSCVLLEANDVPNTRLTALGIRPNTVVFKKGSGLLGWWDGTTVVSFT